MHYVSIAIGILIGWYITSIVCILYIAKERERLKRERVAFMQYMLAKGIKKEN